MGSFIRRIAERAGVFFFNLRNAYYERDSKPVSTDDVLTVVDRRIQDARDMSQKLSGALAKGQLTVAEWREAMAVELRRAHSQAYALGRGGWAQMTPADRAAITARLRSEYGYLRQFAVDVQAGGMSEAQVKARANLYANKVRTTYWEGARASKTEAGYTKERRVLGLSEHCQNCQDYAAMGAVPIGTLPYPGESSVCGANCACEIIFYRAGEVTD